LPNNVAVLVNDAYVGYSTIVLERSIASSGQIRMLRPIIDGIDEVDHEQAGADGGIPQCRLDDGSIA
jgi:hypothetical protein